MNKRKIFTSLLAGLMLFSGGCSSAASASPYKDGEYEATEKGFGGPVTVKLVIKGGAIDQVSITGDSETEGVGKKAIEELPDVILKAQSADFDGVSGATFTSTAVRDAVSAALDEAAGVTAETGENNMKDGTYSTTVESFYFSALADHGNMTMDVTVEDNKIKDIKVHDDYSDTKAIGGIAFEKLTEEAVENQTLALDTVSGATVSSNAFIGALTDCLTQAGANIDYLKAQTIAKRDPVDTELDTQVVVIGAGMAGMSAALEAADQGLDVILVEKQDVLGSSTSRSEGYVMGAGTEEQKAEGIDDSEEAFFDDIWSIYQNEPMADKELLETATSNSGELISFLEDNGVTWTGLTRVDVNEPRATKRIHCSTDKGGGLSSALYASLQKKGVTVLMGTKCTAISQDDIGRVTGIQCTNDFGDNIVINADATILTAGSYAGNREMFEKIQPEANAEALFGYGDGDAYTLAQSVGADMIDLAYPQLQYNLYSPNMTKAPSKRPGSATLPVPEVMLLDGDGKRVTSEQAFCFEYASKVWANGQPDCGWCLFGSAFNERYPDVAEICLNTNAQYNGEPMGYSSDSITDLAQQAGLDPSVLEEQLDRYNELCDLGEDLDFGKDAQYMEKIEGTYYLVRLPQIVTDGYSGCRINKNAEVLDKDGNPIPGFYAAGSCAVGQMSCADYYGCGTSLMICGIYGRIAAESAASLISNE